MKKILVIGGYGNFGSYIAKKLAAEPDLDVIVAGRSEKKCRSYAAEIGASWRVLDTNVDLPEHLNSIKPDVVVHTSGPYQGQGYDVAEACIAAGCHYIDLADAREFVAGIDSLNEKAQAAGVGVISGASSVPCLSSAIVDEFKGEFKKLKTLDYGIATAQQTNRGLATTASILSYTGQPIETLIDGKMTNIYGWQDFHFRTYPEFGRRALSNCEIPDLALFPKRYPDLETIRFYAGTEILFMHLGLWLLSWLPRFKLVKNLTPLGPFLLKAAYMFDWLGSSNSVFHMTMSGIGNDGNDHSKTFHILAKDGHGPYIPCAPSILLAKRLARSELNAPGAYSSMGLINLDDYMDELSELNITKLAE